MMILIGFPPPRKLRKNGNQERKNGTHSSPCFLLSLSLSHSRRGMPLRQQQREECSQH